MNGQLLFAIASKISQRADRVKAIRPLLQQEAETGHFQAVFLRAEYVPSDFDALKGDANITIETTAMHIVVRWDRPLY